MLRAAALPSIRFHEICMWYAMRAGLEEGSGSLTFSSVIMVRQVSNRHPILRSDITAAPSGPLTSPHVNGALTMMGPASRPSSGTVTTI